MTKTGGAYDWRQAKAGKPELDHIRIAVGKAGGHVVTHSMDNGESEPHVFGGDEGAKLMQHVQKTMHVKLPKVSGPKVAPTVSVKPPSANALA